MGILGGDDVTYEELTRRFAAGARLVELAAREGASTDGAGPGRLPLVAVTAEGALRVATGGRGPRARAGDTVITLRDPI